MPITDLSDAQHIFIVTGYTDMRKGIDGLLNVITTLIDLTTVEDAVFLYCGRRRDRYKALYWDGDGFMMLYKRLESGRLQWPKSQQAVQQLTEQQIKWLLEGLSIDQPKAIHNFDVSNSSNF